MKKLFLDNCIKHSSGKIDWIKSEGCELKFIYDDIEGYICIFKYLKKESKIIVRYGDKIFWDKPISASSFKKCHLGHYLSRNTGEFKIDIGDIFKDNKNDLIIIDRKFKIDNGGIKRKMYKYKCGKCPNEDWIEESCILNGVGCNVCASRKVITEYNSMWKTDYWMIEIGVDEEFAKTHTKCCGDNAPCICPSCKRRFKKSCTIIYANKSIFCSCSDGRSYPEKFMISVLTQLDVKFETEYSPDYIKPKRSDFYLPEYNLVIETDGGINHKGGKSHGKSNKTIEEHIEIDKWKDEQHKLNGIHTIRINCFESDMEYIKLNILNSELVNYFNLSCIDWTKCEKFALKNIVKEVCDYWNNKEEWETTYTIAENNNWGIKSGATISNYLKKGVKLEWCSYDPKEEGLNGGIKGSILSRQIISKQVDVFDKSWNLLGTFPSCHELERLSEGLFGVRLGNSAIASVCRGEKNQYKGFYFRYK